MNITRKEQRIIQRALKSWQASGDLAPEDSQRLAQTLRVSPFDWQRLSRYAFWTALACVLVALGSLFADSALIELLLSLFSRSALTRIILPALLAVACYARGFRRQRRETQWHYSTEAILFLGLFLPPWRCGSLANVWIPAAVISRRCSGRMPDLRRDWLLLAPGWCGSFSAVAGQLVRCRNRLRFGLGRLLAGHELPEPLRAVRRRAACALLRRATRFAPAPAVYCQ